MKRICIVPGCNKKINIFAYWFGLRHCEECDRVFMEVRLHENKGEEFMGYNGKKKIIKYYDGSVLEID